MAAYLLAIDQGTTSSRAIVFDDKGCIVSQAQLEFAQHFPRDGWVEHDADEIWATTLTVCRDAIAEAGGVAAIAGIGITNQRETCLFWDRESGAPLGPAIVWQDRRGADLCRELAAAGEGETITAKTGLVLDSYFSATKAKWLLDHDPDLKSKAAQGAALFGTIETFLIWRLTGGKVHATDPTNACRTMLYNTYDMCWDTDLLSLFGIPASAMPEVKESADDFGVTDAALFGDTIPICAAIGDQQSALVGQACFQKGSIKSTYGTGCFLLMNTGADAARSTHGLLTSVGYRVKGETSYVLEGSIFNAGTTIQWLRDNLKLFSHARETETMAQVYDNNRGVYFVPAFTGLGAPHWDPDARGAILGLTRDTMPEDIVRAALEAVCFQTHDLMQAMVKDTHIDAAVLRVDGGMAVNDWLLQFLADTTRLNVERPCVTETTALGCVLLAAYQLGMFASLEDAASLWCQDRIFTPQANEAEMATLHDGWEDAVRRVLVKDGQGA